MIDKPFGRQPKPVKVTLEGDLADVVYWCSQLRLRAEFKGDIATPNSIESFTIYPRAVND